MQWEKFTHPLIVVAAVGGIALWLRKSPGTPIPTPFANGLDPGRWQGEGAGLGAVSQYLAGIPDYAQDPGYIASAAANPYDQDPEDGTSVTGTLSGDPGSAGGSVAPYVTYNTNGGANPWSYLASQTAPSTSGCGCGGCGGCEPKCKGDCDSGVRFPDGRGSCLLPEYQIPMTFYGIVNTFDDVNISA